MTDRALRLVVVLSVAGFVALVAAAFVVAGARVSPPIVESPSALACPPRAASPPGPRVRLLDVVTPSPGGAGPIDTSTQFGPGGQEVGDALDSLAPVPLAMVGGVVGVVVIWWAVRYIGRAVGGRT